MENGTMRVDANISVRPKGTGQMNTKVEVKNMNSIRHVGDAIAYEIERQKTCLAEGEELAMHTRLWDPAKKVTTAMREKFAGPCVPDPSVPPIVISREWLEDKVSRLPEMPAQKAERFRRQFGLSDDETSQLCTDKDTADYFEQVMAFPVPARTATYWMTTQLMPVLRERGEALATSRITPSRFADLLGLLDRNEVNTNSAKEILVRLFETDLPVKTVVDQGGFGQVSDASELEGIVARILEGNAPAVADYHNGVSKALGFLIGQAMQASGGKANPKVVREILMKRLTSP
jgi:aspartyl-tRNA(Asn)/glutamyl-tRNA(Gln) amidotransferase subunit B